MIKTTETVKDFYGKIIGYLETHTNGDVIVKDFYGKILGRYEKITNTTKDFYGRILYRGNQASALFNERNN